MRKKTTKKLSVSRVRREKVSVKKQIDAFFFLQNAVKTKTKQQKLLDEKVKEEARKLRKMQKMAKHYQDLYAGLEELRTLEGLSLSEKTDKTIIILKNEIHRLQKLAKSQQELLEKYSVANPIATIEIPERKLSINPFTLINNVKQYRKEQKEFKELVQRVRKAEVNMTLAKNGTYLELANNGTRGYKAEHAANSKEYIKVGEKYMTTYYLSDVPRMLYPDAMYKLLSSSIPFAINMFVTPLNSASLIKKIRSRLATLEAQQRERLEKGKMLHQKTTMNIEEMSELAEELTHEVEKGFDVALYITIEAKTKEELQQYHEELKNITDSIEFYTTKYTFGQKKAFETTLPFNEDLVGESRFLQTTAVSYMTPFLTKNIYHPDGILMGVNPRQEGLVFIDPFKVSDDPMRNSNINILGVSGSGKSVTSKTIATRLFMKGIQVLVIDPEGEYLDYARAMGGEIIQFSRNNGINPFSIYSTKNNLRNDILDHIGALKAFFKFFVRPERFDATELDDILMDLYEQYPTRKPTFKTFLKKLKGSAMYRDIAVLEKGSLQGVFNAERELELGNDLVVFDLSSLKDTDMKAPAMYLLTSLIWQLVDSNRDQKKMLFIDEAHNLLVEKEVAVFYRKVVKEARKRNLGVVSITQNVEDFLGNEWGNGIITNSETKILLKQSYASLPLMEKIASMTEDERMMLGNLPIGDYVMIREQEHIQAYMYVLPFEQKFVFTTPGKRTDYESTTD